MEYNLPLVEKYRPSKLADIVGQDTIVDSLTRIFDGGSFPHLLFYGGSGSGKTSTIMAILNDYFGSKKKLMVMRLDASDDRGINSVREEIKGFAEKRNYFTKGIKVIILDEADSMTFDAQFALRRIIEKYSSSTRFCLICNYDNKIISAIKSRCAEFKFNPIKAETMKKQLEYIANSEKLSFNDKTLDIICNISKGDMRKAINLMQSSSINNPDGKSYIKENLCYDVAGYPLPSEIEKITNLMLDKNKSLEVCIKKVSKLVLDNGYSISIILKEIMELLLRKITDNEINAAEYSLIFSDLANLESKVSKSTFGDIYLSMMVSIFKQ